MKNHEIIKRTKFGLLSKTKAQVLICDNCLENPDYECKQPCGFKKQQQKQYQPLKREIILFESPDITVYENLDLGHSEHSNGCKLDIEPNRIEQLQLANLSQNIIMVNMTNFRQHQYRKDGKIQARVLKNGREWKDYKW